MLVTNRFVVDVDVAGRLHRTGARRARRAGRPPRLPARSNSLRALDDPRHWSLVTEWESVGTYRRALGGFDVKVSAVPLLAESVDEPSAYETLADRRARRRGGGRRSDRACRPLSAGHYCC